MKHLSRKQWIAVFTGLVVIVIFFITGGNIIYFFTNQNQLNPNKQQNMDLASSSSITGFEIQDITVGTGAVAETGKMLTVHYTGAFTDGRVFDTSRTGGVPFQFTLGDENIISGWNKGLVGMKVGGKRRLVIPPDLAYGPAGVPGIPPNSTLIFEVELLGVK